MYPKDFQKQMGRWLKDYREKAGLSQKAVSDHLGYSSSQFISNIERGVCMPPLKQLRSLVELYNMDAAEVAEKMIEVQEKMIMAQLGLKKSATR